jgi:hypothetical protein
MTTSAKQGNISFEPSTLSRFIRRLLHRVYNAFCEKELYRFAQKRADRMTE